MSCYLPDLGIVNALGAGGGEVRQRLLAGDRSGMRSFGPLLTGRNGVVGRVEAPLPAIPDEFAEFACRNNRLLAAAAEQLDGIADLKERHGAHRIAVLIGTSTSGIAAGEAAAARFEASGTMPENYHYRQQEIGTAAEFLARYLGLEGPRYTISTACSSSAKAFAAAERLIDAGISDAAIVGGADSLCDLTVNGFDALASMSARLCNPFSANRDGINIGEGAALFVMTREPAPIRLAGVGESSDAYHMSAPDPSGAGAERAMRAALGSAGLGPEDIGYINLHGTATPRNDAMESRVVDRVFGMDTPCSSTKSQIGHTLGAAGAQELGLCWLLLSACNGGRRLPEHLWDGEPDPELPPIGLTAVGSCWQWDAMMSNSFAFGGSNVSVILGRG